MKKKNKGDRLYPLIFELEIITNIKVKFYYISLIYEFIKTSKVFY